MAELNDDEQNVLRLRRGIGDVARAYSVVEVAEMLKMTPEQVETIERRAAGKAEQHNRADIVEHLRSLADAVEREEREQIIDAAQHLETLGFQIRVRGRNGRFYPLIDPDAG